MSKLTVTDRRMIMFDLFLLIGYFVCQGLIIVALLRFPLAFYG